MKKVLVVDDEEEVREMVVAGLSDDFAVASVSTGEEALETLEKNPDIVAIIADKDRPRPDNPKELEEVGLKLLEAVRDKHPTVKRVLMSGRLPFPSLDKNLAEAFWSKPFLPSQSVLWLGEILG